MDASCSGYSAADGYTLVPADYGTTIDETALKNAVAEAVEGLEDTLDLEKSGCYVDPAVGDDDKDLLAVIDELNQYVASTVTYDFGDQKEVVDGSTISEWLSVLDGELEVDEEAVLDYVKGLAKTYNTAYKPKTLKTCLLYTSSTGTAVDCQRAGRQGRGVAAHSGGAPGGS